MKQKKAHSWDKKTASITDGIMFLAGPVYQGATVSFATLDHAINALPVAIEQRNWMGQYSVKHEKFWTNVPPLSESSNYVK